MELALVLGMVALVSGLAWRGRSGARAPLEGWRAAFADCGATDVRETSGWPVGLAAEVKGLRVELAQRRDGRSHGGLGITVDLGQPLEFELRREGLGTRLEKSVLGRGEIETGDASFDEAFRVDGQPAAALARLDSETRGALLSLAARVERVGLRGHELACSLDVVELPLSRLVDVLTSALAAAASLARPGDVRARLQANARRDLRTEVRRRCLETLLREFPDDESTRTALAAACSDADPHLRLDAAFAREAAGHDTLRALAGDGSVDDAIAARAIEGLGAAFPAASARELLASSAAAGRVEVARACIAVLTARPDEATVPALVALLRDDTWTLATWMRGGSAQVAVTAIQALVTLGATGVERALLDALRHGDGDVVTAAARALGALGSVAAVPPLRALEQQAQRDDTRRAAYQAVAAIQSRAPGATPGQLSLAASETGQIALAGDERGQVSLADDDDPPAGAA